MCRTYIRKLFGPLPAAKAVSDCRRSRPFVSVRSMAGEIDMRKAITVLSLLCVGIVAVLGFKIWQRWQVQALQIQPPRMDFRAARETFPFSVVPGGLMDTQELSDSMKKDEVVREHYKDIEPSRMWFTRLNKPMLAYVSFRKGSRVGWTMHPVTIAANELVLTDGNKMVRARCGNRIEVKRPEPLPAVVHSPDLPPPDIALDSGLPALVPPTISTPAAPRSEITTLAKNGSPERIATPPTTWCCGITSKTPPNVPEPTSIVLLGAGGLALLLVGRKRK